MLTGPWAGAPGHRYERALEVDPEAKTRVAVLITGDFRTLGTYESRRDFHNFLLAPLQRCAAQRA